MPIGRLHVLTDFFFQQRYSHAELGRLAIAGGADVIQFRQKFGSVRHLIVQVEGLVEVCAAANVPLIVNDRVDLALIDGVSGVHLGQSDFPISLARKVLGPDAIIGATATTPQEARNAEEQGATYIGFGPVYNTVSKANPASVKGLDGLRRAVEAVSIPLIAIAGITPERTADVLETGAHGVAVMTAITTDADPTAATAAFADILRINVGP